MGLALVERVDPNDLEDPLGLERLERRLDRIAADVRRGERERFAVWRPTVLGTCYAASAANLAAYLAFRRGDIRDVQDELADLGLSSLGRSERHVRAGIASVRAALKAVRGRPVSRSTLARLGRLRDAADAILEGRSDALLGPPRPDRRVRIMVTLPSSAVAEPGLISDLIGRGVDIARINAAHDDPDTWRALARTVQDSSTRAGRRCRILVDLPGPKMRVAALPTEPGHLRLRPRSDTGRTAFLLDASGEPGTTDGHASDARVAVDATWLARLRVGDRILVDDARGRSRKLRVDERPSAARARVSSRHGLDLVEGVELGWTGADGEVASTVIGPFEPVEGSILVHVGDSVWLSDSSASRGRRERGDKVGGSTIVCAEPGIIETLHLGDDVLIDDGHVVARVGGLEDRAVRLDVVATRRPDERIRADHGLNFPNSAFRGRGFSPDDLAALDVAVEIADMVGLSFAQDRGDVERLIDELDRRGAFEMGIVAKIETRRGVEHLPDIIVAGAARRPLGVMIARGDLAVEIGYERLAEMQEEILWLCEAAHVPVIWATQVLESLVKTGIPTRAELTDAAMAQRAECVMLNKGAHIRHGVDTLVNVISRMEGHQSKKSARLRALRSW